MKIYTLGNFDIQIDNQSIIEKDGYPYKTIRLFKYFLAFKGKKLLPENIIEDLWNDNDSIDPKNILRTQISRVRKMISTEVGSRDLYSIKHRNGYYVFEINCDYIMDVELFETNMLKGNQLKESNPDDASKILQEGLELYKGQYLQEMEYEEWIIPMRNRYHRLYVQGLMNLIDILKVKNMNQEIVKICEEAIHHEPYGEDLHIEFIEALMAIGEKRYAMNHYEYITARLYLHLRMAPSQKLKAVYKKLQMDDEDVEHVINLSNIEEELKKSNEKAGPVLCEPDYFKLIYDLEKKKKDRIVRRNKFLLIITVYNKGSENVSEEDMKQGMSTLINIINGNFRKGDVISKWNESQIICLLYNLEEEGLGVIRERLNKKYEGDVKNKNIILNTMFKAL